MAILTRHLPRPLSIPILWAILALAPPGSVAEAAAASEVVERLQQSLIAVMQDALDFDARYERLADTIRETHDLRNIARITVGGHWRELDQDQRTLLLDTFEELSIATYAHRFDRYAGERFEILSEERPDTDEAFVHSRFIRSDGDALRFDYMLRHSGGRWRIINIVVDGISDLALRRAEFTSIIRREGFPALITKLRDKISEYAG